MTSHAKLIVAVMLAALASLQAGLSDDVFDRVEVVQLLIMAAAAAKVWFEQNRPGNVAAKASVATTMAVLGLLATYVAVPDFSELSTSQTVNLVVAGLTALGVYLVPNAPTNVSVQRAA